MVGFNKLEFFYLGTFYDDSERSIQSFVDNLTPEERETLDFKLTSTSDAEGRESTTLILTYYSKDKPR